MASYLEIAADERTLKAMTELTDSVNNLCGTLQSVLRPKSSDAESWFSAPHFCQKYDISRSTLTRRVQAGKVERLKFDDGMIRYRIKN